VFVWVFLDAFAFVKSQKSTRLSFIPGAFKKAVFRNSILKAPGEMILTAVGFFKSKI
jgi:hypothetical protein